MRVLCCVFVSAILASGCKSKSDDTPPMPTAQPTATVTQPAVLATAQPAGPGDVVKSELDNRSDGVTGTPVTASGAKASIQVAPDWKIVKGAVETASATDQRSRLGVAAYGAEGPAGQLDKLASGTGVGGCQWAAPQTLTVGKDNLPTQAADGTCSKGATKESAAYMAAEGLVVMGSWDDGADRNALFGAMRSVAKPKMGTAGPTNLVACCRALAQNAKSAPPPQNAYMLQAAATCEAAASANNAAAVNAALAQFGKSCH